MNTIVTFKEVLKKYDANTALDGLSFEISNNECVGLIGNNGSGKTTVINILGNIIGYDGGEVQFNGVKVVPNYISYKKEIGMLLSNPYYINEFSISRYWKFLGEFFKIPNGELLTRMNSLLSALDLENKKNTAISKLSSGNQIKVSFGGTLLHNPKLLLFDEPFVHLDIKSIDKIASIIQDLKNSKTFLITSHNIDLVIDLCDVFLIIDKGRIVKRILKSEYSNNSELKKHVLRYFTFEKSNINLEWLNS